MTSGDPARNGSLVCFAAAALILASGVAVAALRFPGGFDWAYTVISRLASPRHNPAGAPWAAGGLLVAVVLLWPVTRHLAASLGGRPRFPVHLLRMGLVGGAILGIEGLFGLQFSRQVRKAHEIVAILTFLGFYGGVLGLYLHRIREAASFALPALLVVLPLCAVGVSQLALYFDQRDLGWVDTGWRELGVPLWLSFAFWQWLAVLFLGLGIGYLVATAESSTADASSSPFRRETPLTARAAPPAGEA